MPLILLPNLKRNIILKTNYATFAENIKKLWKIKYLFILHCAASSWVRVRANVVNLIEILDKIFRKLPSSTKISNPKLLARRNLKTNKREKPWQGGRIDFSSISYCLKGIRMQWEGEEEGSWLLGKQETDLKWSHGSCNTKPRQQETEVQQWHYYVYVCVCIYVSVCVCACDNWDAGEAATDDDVFIRQGSQNKRK